MPTQPTPNVNKSLSAAEILESQVIEIKRGRMNQFGFEPAWNAYFDFYLGTKYFSKPLLRLEDVAFHLFLRKNLNDHDPTWHMPSIRQMKQRLGISQDKIESMIDRLMGARLLEKESGLQQGPKNANVRNVYIISDPIQGLGEFLVVAAAGSLSQLLKNEWKSYLEDLLAVDIPPVPEIGTGGIPKIGTGAVPDSGTHKHTSFKHTSKKQKATRANENNHNNSNGAGADKNDVVVVILGFGISRKVAQRLANHYSHERILEKIDYLQFLLDERPDQVRNPRGWLRRAIEEDYGAPDGYISATERQKQAEAAERQRQEEQAELQATLQAAESMQQAKAVQKAAIERQLAAEWGTDEQDHAVWDEVKLSLKYANFSPIYLSSIRLLKLADGIAKIGVDSDFIANQLGHPGTLAQLARAFRSHLDYDVKIELIVVDEVASQAAGD